ncbi:TetR/AcrR family transcriptional regulator [Streptomyces sp. NPDC088387]|uniref:TetR/AcrR family transcriptional regulator n=1 Tax=Streptomyces sp. NPDC088387 TaxID=3365859 RepID=UPI0037FE9E55
MPKRPPLRKDAERNRCRILTAAREVFRDYGTGATLDDVARHAELGVGTVYRRFANKEALIDALFEDMVDRVEILTRQGLAAEDPWSGLTQCLIDVCEVQAFDRGLRELMLGTGKGPERRSHVHARVGAAVAELLERAQRQGTLRPDIVPADIPMIQLMVAAISDHAGRPEHWRRYLALVMDGLRTQPGATSPLPAFTGDDEPSGALSDGSTATGP